APKYFGTEVDNYAISKVIADWLNKYNRHNSPKYLTGVSYGGIRCAILPGFLMGGGLHISKHLMGITFNGVISMSDCMMYDMHTGDITLKGEPMQVSILPTCAATYHYHFPEGKPCQNDFINEAEAWGYSTFKNFL
ncbi:MAG: hypothetical protein ACK5LL_04940, partial [Suipraeoptans sp.]